MVGMRCVNTTHFVMVRVESPDSAVKSRFGQNHGTCISMRVIHKAPANQVILIQCFDMSVTQQKAGILNPAHGYNKNVRTHFETVVIQRSNLQLSYDTSVRIRDQFRRVAVHNHPNGFTSTQITPVKLPESEVFGELEYRRCKCISG